MHHAARSTGNSMTTSEAEHHAADDVGEVDSPCSSSQVPTSTTNSGSAARARALHRPARRTRVERRRSTTSAAARSHSAYSGPANDARRASPTATSATVAREPSTRPATDVASAARRVGRRPPAAAVRPPASPQKADSQIFIIDTSVSRLHAIATATSTPLTGVEPGGDQTELGDEAGERRDPGQAERRQQEQQRRGTRSGAPDR